VCECNKPTRSAHPGQNSYADIVIVACGIVCMHMGVAIHRDTLCFDAHSFSFLYFSMLNVDYVMMSQLVSLRMISFRSIA